MVDLLPSAPATAMPAPLPSRLPQSAGRRPVDDLTLADLAHEDRMHRLAYANPDVFELEMDRIFASSWVYVGHESEVPRPGDFLTTEVGRQPVILTRDQGGAVRVLFNRCMHRGAVVCREERGSASYFRCLYHGWTYGSDGKLIQIPFRGGYPDDLDTGALGLPPVPNVGSYRGFVFACLAPDVEPLDTYLGRAKSYIDLMVDLSPTGEIEITSPCKYAYEANWKLHLENWSDNYHPPFTHEAIFKITDARRGGAPIRVDGGAQNADLGHGHSMIDWATGETGPRPIYFKVDAAHRVALEQRLGLEQAERVLTRGNMNLTIFPNLMFRSESPHILVLRPIRADYTEMYTYGYRLKGASDEENDRYVQRVPSVASPVQTDDLEAFERIQDGLRIPSIEWVLFNRGLHRQWVDPSGEIRGMGGDEVGHRGQHREWRRLMLQEPRRCCQNGHCVGPQAEMV